jgi:hypothetical protein
MTGHSLGTGLFNTSLWLVSSLVSALVSAPVPRLLL